MHEHLHTGNLHHLRDGSRKPILSEPTEPWLKVAKAIFDDDQKKLDAGLEEACGSYPPLGYSIILRGFKSFLEQSWGEDEAYRVRLPKAQG